MNSVGFHALAAAVVVGLFLAVIALGRIADNPGPFGPRRRDREEGR